MRAAAGDKPPADAGSLTTAESKTFLTAISAELLAKEAARRKAEGRAASRRLNRTEIENAWRDLLELPGLAVKELLPEDGRLDGFDRSAAALDFSPTLLAKLAEAADFGPLDAWASTPIPSTCWQSSTVHRWRQR